MPGFFKEYFYYTKGERNGAFLLLILMVMAIAFPHFYLAFKSKYYYKPDPGFIARIHAFYYPGEDSVDYNPQLGKDTSERHTVFSEGENSRLNPGDRSETRDASVSRIELNSADTADLIKISGIGPVLSRRILRYRDILGGYYDVSQIIEVYGIDEDRYLKTKPYLYADTSRVIKLRLKSDEFGVLLRHPYLNYGQVAEIFRLRNGNALNSPEDLINSGAFIPDDITRLSGYLNFD